MQLVVLGWFARHQQRIRFVKLLRKAVGCRLSEALRMMATSLEAENLPLEIRGITHPFALGRELAACGAEVRVVQTEAQLAHIREQLAAVDWQLQRAQLEQAIRKIAPQLRPEASTKGTNR